MSIYNVPFSEVTGRIYGYWAFDMNQPDVLQGFINASSPEKIAQMSRVAESAAEIVMATIPLHPLAVSKGGSLGISNEGLAAAFKRKQIEAIQNSVIDSEFATELMALNMHLDNGGFQVESSNGLQESYARVAKAFIAYGESA